MLSNIKKAIHKSEALYYKGTSVRLLITRMWSEPSINKDEFIYLCDCLVLDNVEFKNQMEDKVKELGTINVRSVNKGFPNYGSQIHNKTEYSFVVNATQLCTDPFGTLAGRILFSKS